MNIPCDVMPVLFMFLMITLEFYKKIELFLMRKKGELPKKGYETITDVENFMRNNKRTLAIICYRLIDTQVSWKVAAKEVDKIGLELEKTNINN